MSVSVLHIQERYRERTSQIAVLDNFTWSEDDSIDAEQIVDNPNISLYCLDHEHHRAIFAVLPDGIDLSRVPFVYQAQFDNAQHLIAVPYETFLQLADKISVDASQLICVHNIGRCGSTLLCQALNEVDSVIALSEPDVFANFITIRHSPREEQIPLLQASFKFTFRPAVVGNATRYALKLRNQCVDIMELYATTFPQAKHLFMYRNGIDWIASIYRLVVNSGNTQQRRSFAEEIERQANYLNLSPADVADYFDPSIEMYTPITSMAVGWLFMMIRYVEIYQRGFHPVGIRYEDLTTNRDLMLGAIFDQIGLPATAIGQAKQAFERDSQAGTRLARDDAQSGNQIQIPDSELLLVKQIIARQTTIGTPDVILAGTLSV